MDIQYVARTSKMLGELEYETFLNFVHDVNQKTKNLLQLFRDLMPFFEILFLFIQFLPTSNKYDFL